MTGCKDCHDLRAAWVEAVIARDAARVASVTVAAAKHAAGFVADLVVDTIADDQPPPRKRRGK